MANTRVSRRGLVPDGALVGTFALDTIAARDKRFPAQSPGSPARLMHQRRFLRDRHEGILQTDALEYPRNYFSDPLHGVNKDAAA